MKTTLDKINSVTTLPDLYDVVTKFFDDNMDIYAGLVTDSLGDDEFVRSQIQSALETQDFELAKVLVAFLEMEFLLTEPK